MSQNEPEMPKTPEEWRVGIIAQAAGDVQGIEKSVNDARAEMKDGCTPARQRFLTKEVSELQRIKNALKRQIKRLGG